jgi:hypothetical protein
LREVVTMTADAIGAGTEKRLAELPTGGRPVLDLEPESLCTRGGPGELASDQGARVALSRDELDALAEPGAIAPLMHPDGRQEFPLHPFTVIAGRDRRTKCNPTIKEASHAWSIDPLGPVR